MYVYTRDKIVHRLCGTIIFLLVSFTPYWDHVLDFWNRKTDPNILFLTYEEMKSVSKFK